MGRFNARVWDVSKKTCPVRRAQKETTFEDVIAIRTG
jgi:hypothetical protein